MHLLRLSSRLNGVPPDVFITSGGIVVKEVEQDVFEALPRRFDARINQTVLNVGESLWALEAVLMKEISAVDIHEYEERTVRFNSREPALLTAEGRSEDTPL